MKTKILQILPLLLSIVAIVLSGATFRAHQAAMPTFGAVNGPSNWNVAAWFIDPANLSTHASDANDCQTSSTPCVSIGQIVSRWGTKFPTFSVAVTVTFLSDDVATDPWDVVPTIIGAGGLVIKGTLVQVDTATIGTFTARNRSAGTKATITANGQTGSYWSTACGGTCVGMDVHDTTANAQFWIDADNGTATAAITEPFTLPIISIPTRQAIANGDSLTVYRPTTVYITRADVVSVGTGAGNGFLITQLTWNADFLAYVGGLANVTEVVNKSPSLEPVVNATLGNPILASVYSPSGGFVSGSFFVAGGSPCNTPGSQFTNRSILDYDVIINQRPHSEGVVQVADAYFASGQWFTDTGGPQTWVRYLVAMSNGGVTAVWGPATIAVTSGEQLAVRGGATAAGSLLATGGLTLDTLGANGFTFNTSTGAFSSGATAMTPALVDTNGAYINPRSGSRIYVTP